MKAIVIREFGSPEVLQYETDWPRPRLEHNQVMLEVQAAGINPLDWRTRNGELAFFTGKRFPRILGNDASGRVVETGAAVTGYQPGDEVFCFLDAATRPSWKGFAKSGAYAQYAVTRADTLARKPDCLTHEEAAAVPLAALNAYQALTARAGVEKGDRVLINGASGGVGTMAVQIANALGGDVTAVCSGANRELVIGLGANHCLNYEESEISELEGGYRLIYDVVANQSFERCRNLLTNDGTFISNVANPRAMLATWFSPVLKTLGARRTNGFAWVRPNGRDLGVIAEMIESGRVRPVIDRVYPMESVRAAHEYGETGRVRGKLVLRVTQ